MKYLLVVVLAAMTTTLVGATALSDDFAGTWEYVVDTPEGTYSGALVLETSGEGYAGNLLSNGSTYELSGVQVDGADLRCNVNVDGYYVIITGSFEGDILKAMANVQGMELPFTAKKKS